MKLPKYFALSLYNNKGAIKAFAQEKRVPEMLSPGYPHPPEDSYLVSKKYPIYAVSDGVTLDVEVLSENRIKYPDPSPAGDVARLFCEEVIDFAELHYTNLSGNLLTSIFNHANSTVGELNKKLGKSIYCNNETGYFAATGAFIAIKDNLMYWARICDSYVALYDKNMYLKFITNGNCKPYSVINGEARMANYLETGTNNLDYGDILFVFTDGFDKHFEDRQFLNLFKNWDDKLKERIKEFSVKVADMDPKNYGHERTLIAVRHC